MTFIKFGVKTPYEEYHVAFNFENYLGDAGIASATVAVVERATGTVVTGDLTTVGLQLIADPRVYVWVKGGTVGRLYDISCKIVADDTNGSKYEIDGTLPIDGGIETT